MNKKLTTALAAAALTLTALDTDGDFEPDTGEAITDGIFHESTLRSAPYFAMRIDGITELNANG